MISEISDGLPETVNEEKWETKNLELSSKTPPFISLYIILQKISSFVNTRRLSHTRRQAS